MTVGQLLLKVELVTNTEMLELFKAGAYTRSLFSST